MKPLKELADELKIALDNYKEHEKAFWKGYQKVAGQTLVLCPRCDKSYYTDMTECPHCEHILADHLDEIRGEYGK